MCYFERNPSAEKHFYVSLEKNGIISPTAEIFCMKKQRFFANADKTVYQKCLSSVVLCKYLYQAKRYAIN